MQHAVQGGNLAHIKCIHVMDHTKVLCESVCVSPCGTCLGHERRAQNGAAQRRAARAGLAPLPPLPQLPSHSAHVHKY